MSEKKPVIVCVDDEQIILNSLSKQLIRKFGNKFDYEFAESAEEAIEIINELIDDGFDVVMVISDQIMPGMAGDEFLVGVHKQYPRPIKILLTGQAAIEAAINAVNEADLYRYLTKPWDEDDFLLTVERGIQQYYLFDETVKQNEVFRKFVPKEFLEFLGRNNILDVKLGDQTQKEMSIMFTDIRSFTTLSETMSPSDNFNFINAYLKRITPIIRKYNGIIDKYIGDAVMALFPEKSHVVIDTAIEIHRAIAEYNEYRIEAGYLPIQIGIGLHTGNLMLGTIGDDDRMQGTVISDSVNLASRIENLNKVLDSSTLVSESTFNLIPNEIVSDYKYRLIGKIKVRGKSNPIGLYDFFDGDRPEQIELKEKTLELFNSGLQLFYAKKFDEAKEKFSEVLTVFPTDKATSMYKKRCEIFLDKKVPEGLWDTIDMENHE